MKNKVVIKFLTVAAATLVMAAGLIGGVIVAQELIAQEPPPQKPKGAIGTVNIVTSDKCSATVEFSKPGEVLQEASFALPPGQCNRMTGEQIASDVTTAITNHLETCVLISDLPADDPDKTTNPATPSLYWKTKEDGLDYLCNRLVNAQVSWNGIGYDLKWESVY